MGKPKSKIPNPNDQVLRLICTSGAESPEGRALEQEGAELVNIISVLINKGKRFLTA